MLHKKQMPLILDLDDTLLVAFALGGLSTKKHSLQQQLYAVMGFGTLSNYCVLLFVTGVVTCRCCP